MHEQAAVDGSGLVVRAATVADAGLVGRLLHEFNTEFAAPTPSAEEFAVRFDRLLGRDDVIVLLAETERDAAGFAYLTLRPTPYGDGPLAQLEELYVRPRLRARRIGTALLGAALREVETRQAIELRVEVDEEDLDARRFYERHGFVNTETGTDSRMLCYLREL